MKKDLLFGVLGLCLMASCAGNKTGHEIIKQIESSTPDMTGQWMIENIVFNDSDYVRPSEIDADLKPYIKFEDGSYSISTGCNFMNGAYTQNGDSITFGDGMITEMACDHMEVEDALKRILPSLTVVDIENDSIARINGAVGAEYVVLRKSS